MLTAKQEAFATKYVECGDATAAYRFAYDCSRAKPTTVNRQGKRNFDKPKIRARITELQAETAQKLLVSEESVLREFARLGFSDIRNLFEVSGNLKNINDLDENIARAVSSVKVVTKKAGQGEVEYVSEIKLWPKTAALDSLGKNLGLFDHKEEKDEGETFNVNLTVRKKVE
jgi:phage terminase small subunit